MGAIRASVGGDLASSSGDPELSGNAAPPAAHRAAPGSSLVPGGREITLFVIFSFAVLLALLASTVWVEVRSKYLYR